VPGGSSSSRGVAGAGVVPHAVVFLVPGVVGGLCSVVQHLVLQVHPGDGLAASTGGGGAAPFRRRTHGVVGLELAGGRAPPGVGFVACRPDLPSAAGAGGRWRLRRWQFGARACIVARRSLLCHPSPPSRPCLLLWAGVSCATVRSGGSGSSMVVCGVGMWAAVAPPAFAVVRVPADLRANRGGGLRFWKSRW
jgi:hypothetical protein